LGNRLDNPRNWRFFPEPWARFRDGIPEAERNGSLVEAYHRLLMNPDPAIHEKGARDSELMIVGRARHDSGMSERIVAATDRFAASERRRI
jgi:hypothetical protein